MGGNSLEDKFRIIGDDRESDVNAELSKFKEVALLVARLENGVDGIWAEDWAWQRKRGDDLTASIMDGRMHDVIQQQELYPHLVLIIEDKERAFAEGRLPESAIMGAVASSIYWKHCSVVYTRDFAQTALFIKCFAAQLHKEQKNYPVIRHKSPMSLEERQLFLLQGFYKCGPEISIRLLAKYKTPWAVINAIGQNSIDVDKVGAKLLAEWRRELGI